MPGRGQAGAAPSRSMRTTDATCDGWPRAPIGMAPGFCAGIVVAPPEDFDDPHHPAAARDAAAAGRQGLPGHRHGQMEQPGRQACSASPLSAASPPSSRRCSPTFICRMPSPTALKTWGRAARSMSTNRAASSASIPWPPIRRPTIETVIADAPDTRVRYQFPPPVQLHLRCQQRHAGVGGRAQRPVPEGRQARRHKPSATSRKATTRPRASAAMPIWATANGRPTSP